MGAHFRLTPTMASRKLQALAFIKRYFAEWGRSPSYGEIGHALGVDNPATVNRIMRALEADGEILRAAGARRDIRLPEVGQQLSEEDVLRLLSARGFTIIDGPAQLLACFGDGVRNTSLPLIPELDHIPDVGAGGIDDRDEQHSRSEGPARDRRARGTPRRRRAA